MRVTFPHMGLLSIPVRSLFHSLGHEVIVPPVTNKRTFELGSKYSPEFACLPFKINLGNFIEALELGADTIVMGGGVGPCRFGYYGQVQREILQDLGFDFQLLLLDPPSAGTKELSKAVRLLAGENSLSRSLSALRLAWVKTRLLDEGNRLYRMSLPQAMDKKAARRIYEEFLSEIDQEMKAKELSRIFSSFSKNMREVRKETEQKVLRVKIIGEIYMVLEPNVNFHLEETLGELGVEVHRQISMSGWVEEHLFGSLFPHHEKRKKALAKPFLSSFVGGHGQETVAEMVDAGVNKYDGVIQVLPFTCMPEIVAQSILPEISREFALPILYLVLDEHSAEAGIHTRLEAFVDLLARKKRDRKELEA